MQPCQKAARPQPVRGLKRSGPYSFSDNNRILARAELCHPGKLAHPFPDQI